MYRGILRNSIPYRSCRIWGSGGGPKNGRSFGLPYKIYGDPPGAGERSTASSGTPGGTDPRGRCPGRHVEYGGRACTLSAERTPNPASPGHVEVHMYFVWGTYCPMRAHLGTLRAPPYKYMGHPPCNLADKHLHIFQNSEGWQIYFGYWYKHTESGFNL